jgi:nitroreductase
MGIPMKDMNGNYVSNEENACVCIYCGHCVTVCPARAITLNVTEDAALLAELADYGIKPVRMAPGDCEQSLLDEIPSYQQVESLIRSRRMARSFKPEPVDNKSIEHIFKDVLVYAPAGHNIRGFEVVVVNGRKKLDDLTGLSCDFFQTIVDAKSAHTFDIKVFKRIIAAWREHRTDRVFRGAYQAVVVHCPASYVPADPAVKVLLTYFEFLANAMGIGTTWAGYFMVAGNYEPIKEYLKIPEENNIYGAMMFGWPSVKYTIIPKRPAINIHYLN